MMRHLRNKFGLRLKVTWVGLSGTILALSMATAAVMFQIRWLITYEQGEAARMIAQGIGDAAELALAVRDQSELERLADGFMRNKQVLFIALYDKAGKCLARSVRDANAWNVYDRHAPGGDLFMLGRARVEVGPVLDGHRDGLPSCAQRLCGRLHRLRLPGAAGTKPVVNVHGVGAAAGGHGQGQHRQ